MQKLHLWLGLLVGLLVFIISITGAIYVFKDEIQNALRKDAIWHGNKAAENTKPLSVDILMEKMKTKYPTNEPLGWITVPIDKNKSYEFHYYKRDRTAWNYNDEFQINKTVYVDPFSGEIKKIYDEKKDFFFIILRIHFALLLGTNIGSWVVGITILLFVIMLISGIVLWWPKNKNARKQRLWFRWKNVKNWRRKNYDLHSVLGFYSSFFALIIAITGLFYAFKIVPKIIYFSTSGGQTEKPEPEKFLTPTKGKKLPQTLVLDKISNKVEALHPTAKEYTLMVEGKGKKKKENTKKSEIISVQVRQLSHSYHIRHQLFFDANNGDFLLNKTYGDLGFGEKILMANYDIHTGQIFGIWTKILALIISLICASLPITGFLVWWGKRKKKDKKQISKKALHFN